VKTIHDTPTPSARSLVPALWAILIAAIFLLSVLALLQIRVDVYDESALLLGARLVRNGRLPYIDFYTHYGPLGYTLIAAGSRISRNPGLALRILQAAFLAATLLLLLAMTRKKPNSIVAPLGLGGAAFGAFAAANVFRSAAFLGFAFCLAALTMAVLSRAASSTAAARLATVAGGVAVVCAGLVRPVFAAYSGVAIAAIEVAERSGAGKNRNASRRVLLFVGAASVALCVIWITLYPRIPPVVAFEASVLVPGRLVGGGERFLNPRFLLSPTGAGLAAFGAVLAGGLVAAASACWTLAARSSSTRMLAALAGVAAALGTARLEGSSNPGVEAALLSGVLLLASLVAVFRMRMEIAESAPIAAGTVFGVAAMAFGHYFWTRSDREHLGPALALAAIAVAFVWPRLGTVRRIFVASVFGAIALLFPQLPLRVPRLAASGAPVWTLAWPAATVPRDAAAAVRFADEHSDLGSRCVAVASTHSLTSANPVLLFLLSSRRPYTRWYTYDPGLQSSPAVQEQMARELIASGSRAAIVWNARLYVFEPRRADLTRKTPLDEVFDRLYPVHAAQFGEYEVRFRAEAPGR
jgi:hypothetical protein